MVKFKQLLIGIAIAAIPVVLEALKDSASNEGESKK